jgi:adenylate cyclase
MDPSLFIQVSNRAIELNPNMADGHFVLLLTHAGRTADAIEFMKRVKYLNPLFRPIYLSYLVNAYYLNGQYELSLETGKVAFSRMPDIIQARIWYSAAAAQLSLGEEAHAAADEVLRLRPNFTISRFVQSIALTNAEDSNRLAEGLRKAGLPD